MTHSSFPQKTIILGDLYLDLFWLRIGLFSKFNKGNCCGWLLVVFIRSLFDNFICQMFNKSYLQNVYRN